MITGEQFRNIAFGLPEVIEAPHFENTAFKVAKKIFATLNVLGNRATVKLSLTDQDVFCTFDADVIYPVPNKWGKHGWTHVNLQAVNVDMLTDVLKTAYKETAPKKLGDLVTFDE